MGHAGLLTALLAYFRRSLFFESPSGVIVYLLLTAIAFVLWLGSQFRQWPNPDQEKGPITLGLDDLSNHEKRDHR